MMALRGMAWRTAARMLANASIAALLMLTLLSCTPVVDRRPLMLDKPAPNGASDDSSTELLVFAASSLTDAMDEIAAAFEARTPGVQVMLNFGGSSALVTQLLEGGTADVFASANQAQMQKLVDVGRVTGEQAEFATNRLVVITAIDPSVAITSLADLAQPGIRLVLAVPGVPIRDYTDTMVAALAADPAYGDGYARAFYENLVSEEPNVRQVAAKVALGEADAAVVYTSDITPDLADRVRRVEVPEQANVVAVYPVAALNDAPQPAMAEGFVDFMLSSDGQDILAKWGFGPKPQ